jgi:hypothetical protein
MSNKLFFLLQLCLLFGSCIGNNLCIPTNTNNRYLSEIVCAEYPDTHIDYVWGGEGFIYTCVPDHDEL